VTGAVVPGRWHSMSDRLTRAQRLQTTLIASTLAPAISGLCRTLTWRVRGAGQYDALIQSGQQPIIAFWHGRILPATWYFRNRGILALTSGNFDGQWIAGVLERLGNRTVAGSSSHGGARAMLELRRAVLSGHSVAFAVDGPRGPAGVLQPGAAWLAASTGHPILPFHAEASSSWNLSSWDRTQVPRPFSTVSVVLGAPIVPSRVQAQSPDELSRDLSDALAVAERECLAALADRG
jgi:lysophospholipid acyltransferase (LPLAT)-like uncharacterized protein